MTLINRLLEQKLVTELADPNYRYRLADNVTSVRVSSEIIEDVCKRLDGIPFMRTHSGNEREYFLFVFETPEHRKLWVTPFLSSGFGQDVRHLDGLDGSLDMIRGDLDTWRADAAERSASIDKWRVELAAKKLARATTLVASSETITLDETEGWVPPVLGLSFNAVPTTVADYDAAGIITFPMYGGTKVLANSGSPAKWHTSKKIDPGQNVAFHTRPDASLHSFVDIDFDNPACGQFAFLLDALLPEGRKMFVGSTLKHVLYGYEKEPRKFPSAKKLDAAKCADKYRWTEHKGVLLEFFSNKHLRVPPSTNDRGETLFWHDGFKLPPVLDKDQIELLIRVYHMIGFFTLLRASHAAGARNEKAGWIGRICLRFGLPHNVALHVYEQFYEGENDKEWGQHVAYFNRGYLRGEGGFFECRKDGSSIHIQNEDFAYLSEWHKKIIVEEKQIDGIMITGAVRDMSNQLLAAFAAHKDGKGNPLLFKNGNLFTRVEEEGPIGIDHEGFKNVTRDVVTFYRPGKEGSVESDVPDTVVKDILATPKSRIKLQTITEFTDKPVFSKDGRLHTKSGYDPMTGIFLRPAFELPPVSENPTPDELQAATAKILEPFQDFPFVDECDRAHIVALMCEDFVRNLFPFAPFRIISKTGTGSGGTLLTDTAMYPAAGTIMTSTAYNSNAEEARKMFSTFVMKSPRFIRLEEAHWILHTFFNNSGTSEFYTDRLLGSNAEISVRNNWTTVFVGNDVRADPQIARRSLPVFLDAEVERPGERRNYTITDLPGHMKTNRAAIIHSVLTVIQSWIAAGMPEGKRTLASFEGYSRVVGGILDHAGIEGFLDVPDDRMPLAEQSPNDALQRTLVLGAAAKWNAGLGNYPPVFRATHLLDLAKEIDLPFTDRGGMPLTVEGLGRRLTQRTYDVGSWRFKLKISTKQGSNAYSIMQGRIGEELEVPLCPEPEVVELLGRGPPF